MTTTTSPRRRIYVAIAIVLVVLLIGSASIILSATARHDDSLTATMGKLSVQAVECNVEPRRVPGISVIYAVTNRDPEGDSKYVHITTEFKNTYAPPAGRSTEDYEGSIDVDHARQTSDGLVSTEVFEPIWTEIQSGERGRVDCLDAIKKVSFYIN